MIDDVIARWHRYLGGELPGGLDELLSDDVVFYSPVVYTPQRGKLDHDAVPGGGVPDAGR